jgi:IS5 family transposase
VPRQFCRVYLEEVPDDAVLIRWANSVGPETLRALNGRVVQLARSLKVTGGRKSRVDTTAIETEIHYPTDSGLVGGGVRVVSRQLRRARAALGEAASGPKEAFHSRVRTVRKLSQQLRRIARRKGKQGREAWKVDYGRLVAIAKRTGALGRRCSRPSRGTATTLRDGWPIGSRRSCPGWSGPPSRPSGGSCKDHPVPSSEKLVSLFEPHVLELQHRHHMPARLRGSRSFSSWGCRPAAASRPARLSPGLAC